MRKQLFLSLVALFLDVAVTRAYENVYGETLRSCSSSGMALTGYTRTGYCVDQNDDAGSHHICIDMSSTEGGNFCQVTGQSDWCSSDMPCHDEADSYCTIQNWCVCQWAFASYLQNAGGCSMIQDIVCDAINMEAIKAYKIQSSSNSKYQDALDCLAERCNIDVNAISEGTWFMSIVTPSDRRSILGLLAFAALLGAAFSLYRRKTSTEQEDEAKLSCNAIGTDSDYKAIA